ncbi:HU family DNA-binding protein [Porphyromonas circumdentaria]|uniref:DNA-binding protein, histone-like, putative n=1 Tax=Porphyromonas circumdentaria TaxID=29524 RepID=A0A1T4LY34_9PORP|nr:HU family DNA-binding protein [Porphyromonas circumdentaria]MDO4722084.1 HU family DNA-binding protein [Porphyromonas circumdentaria]SJZ59438.1 DNA-binding protein, histone-like, putative [Porphyromonas circumdentaria]
MLKYHVKKEILRVGKERGKSVYYAAQVPHKKISPKEVENQIMQITSLSRTDVRATLSAFAEVIREEILLGNAVDLANLGTLKIVSIGKRKNERSEVSTATLKTPRIQFLPKHSLALKAREIECKIIDEEEVAAASGERKSEEVNNVGLNIPQS